MSNSPFNASPAFKQGLKQSTRLSAKMEKNRQGNRTEPHRLLSEQDARGLRQDRVDAFTSKCTKAVERRDIGASILSVNDREAVGRVIGGSPLTSRHLLRQFSCLASNPHARSVFFDGLFGALTEIWKLPPVKMYFTTITCREWCLPLDAKLFDLDAMRLRIENAFHEIGWNGVFVLEIQPVTNMGKIRFLFHVHGFSWPQPSEGKKFREARASLSELFPSMGESKGVTLSLVKQTLERALATRFFYATKLPDKGKSFSPTEGKEGISILDQTGKLKEANAQNYTDLDALRIARFLAQYEVDDTVFAVGEGQPAKNAGRRALTAKVETLRGLKPDPTPRWVLSVFSKLLRD